MVLEVTCHEHCPDQPNIFACQDKLGCEWHNATESCKIDSSETFGGNGWIGVLLSMVGDIIINVGMNAMKHAHNINQDPITKLPVKHFVYVPWWWCGIVGVVGGELANLVAYGYAPASVVTPIGSIGVVTNVFITTLVLKEKFTYVNFCGVLSVITGIVLVVYYAPQAVIDIKSSGIWEDVIYTMQGAVYFALFVGGLCIMYPLSRKYGEKYVWVYIMMCAIIASLTIVCAKTFSSIFKRATDNGFGTEFGSPVPYVTILVMVVTAVVSTGYVNKAMMTFGNAQVVPTYFALFTTCSVASVAWVYREFDCLLDVKRGALFLVGIVLAVGGVYLVQMSHVDPRDKDGGSFIIRPPKSASSRKIRPTPSGGVETRTGSAESGPTWSRAKEGGEGHSGQGAEVDIENCLPDSTAKGDPGPPPASTPYVWESPTHAHKADAPSPAMLNGYSNGHGNGNGNGHGNGCGNGHVNGNGVLTPNESGDGEVLGEVGEETRGTSIELARPGTGGSGEEVQASVSGTSMGRNSAGGDAGAEGRGRGRSGRKRKLRQLKPLPAARLPPSSSSSSPSKRDDAPLLPSLPRSLPD